MKQLAQDIIIAPVITEKSMSGVQNKRYTFKVAKGAGKIEIKKAIEEVFGVKVAKVNTLTIRRKFKRMGRNEGYTAGWKKAVVTLEEKSKAIDFFEGLM